MKRLAIAAIAVALSLEASAFEKYMLRIPDELGPKDGVRGVTQEFARAAVSIPLRDGNWIYIINDSPTPPGETDHLLSYLHLSQQAGKRILGAAFDRVYLDIVDAFEEFEG